MYIRQYKEVAADQKRLTQRILTAAHSIIGRYRGSGVKITFADLPRYAVEYQRTLDGDESPLSVYEDNLTDAGLYKNDRLLYHVGGIYTVMHKREKPAVRVFWPNGNDILGAAIVSAPMTKAEAEEFDGRGWKKLQIKVTGIRFGLLQAMTNVDVVEEGKPTRESYMALWNEINGASAWAANPLVARIAFRVCSPTVQRNVMQPQREDRRLT